jgi:hypothetical protein
MMNTRKKKILFTSSYPTMGFPPTHTNHPPSVDTPTLVKETNTTTHKWASFSYTGKETTFITNLFKKTDLKVTWCTTNTIQRLLMPQHQPPDKYAYKLVCPDCNKAYVGQTGRSSTMRFKEHK